MAWYIHCMSHYSSIVYTIHPSMHLEWDKLYYTIPGSNEKIVSQIIFWILWFRWKTLGKLVVATEQNHCMHPPFHICFMCLRPREHKGGLQSSTTPVLCQVGWGSWDWHHLPQRPLPGNPCSCQEMSQDFRHFWSRLHTSVLNLDIKQKTVFMFFFCKQSIYTMT